MYIKYIYTFIYMQVGTFYVLCISVCINNMYDIFSIFAIFIWCLAFLYDKGYVIVLIYTFWLSVLISNISLLSNLSY